MLKPIIEDMQLGSKFVFRPNPCLVAILSENNRDTKAPRQKQRLISKLYCRAGRIDFENPVSLPAIASGKNIEFDPSGFKQLTQQKHKWRFSGTTNGQIPDTDDGTCKAPGTKNLPRIKGITYLNASSEEGSKRVHFAEEP